MATDRHVFRFSESDLALMDALHRLYGLSNRSALLRWLVYREARSQGIASETAAAELPKGRPNKGLGNEEKIPPKKRKRD